MLPPFRRAISHRAMRLTKYSRLTDINSCFFGGRKREGEGERGGGAERWRTEVEGFFTRRAFKVGVTLKLPSTQPQGPKGSG